MDSFIDNPRTGRFVLVDNYDIVGGGVISLEGVEARRCVPLEDAGDHLTPVAHRVTLEDRRRQNRHRGGILWLTGLSGAGKSTISMELERRLFQKGYQVYTLDGDNLRRGLCSDLGFSPEDRAENIRRAGEVANLFAQAGMLVIAAFISPYRADRDRVRAIAGGLFHEVHVKASVEECARRDPKGLYAKAGQGGIGQFTGVSAPYEPPLSADLVIDTDALSIDESVTLALRYVERDMQRGDIVPSQISPDVAL